MLKRFLHCSCIILAFGFAACSADDTGRTGGGRDGGGGGGGNDGGGGGGDDAFVPTGDGSVGGQDGMLVVQDPKTCAEAAMNKSYIGCDYWPTITFNPVWNVFDFAVVISNPGTDPADVTVTGPPADKGTTPFSMMITVMPGTLGKINLPWKSALKGADATAQGMTTPPSASVLHQGGAYHLVSTKPVLVYQFNALEYKGGTGGQWANCPGSQPGGAGCFSYSNDASLLLPSTAMTGNYRVATERGLDSPPNFFTGQRTAVSGGFVAITATQDATTVKIKLSTSGSVVQGSVYDKTGAAVSGSSVRAIAAGGTDMYMLNAGDVLELLSANGSKVDLSGSLVQADKPVQLVGGHSCMANPQEVVSGSFPPQEYSCDHIEEIVLPAETIGKHYFVTVPTGPNGSAVGHTVRFVGNVDGTKLSYSSSVNGAPSTLNAGQVVELANVSQDFEVTGDHEFIVNDIQLSGGLVDPNGGATQKGDPSLSAMVSVEQYRLSYVFLAPQDYDVNYADVVAPTGAKLMLDGAAVSTTPKSIGTGYGLYRIKLGAGMNGAHTLTSDQPAGLQVSGYGAYTSYQYPAGLDLLQISAPPPPIS